MDKASKLDEAISAVCPIFGVVVGAWDDRATWTVSFKDEATVEQKADAQIVIDNFDALIPTVDDVRAEAQRRILALMGARDFTDCVVKQLNANKTAVALNDKRISGGVLTPEEEATATALRGLADAIDAFRAASNVLEPSPPADYADDKYWP